MLWKPLFNNDEDMEQTIYSTHRVPSKIQFLREFKLDHCQNWYVRFESPPPYHNALALGNEKGEVKVWHVGGNEKDDSGCHPKEKYFCNLTTPDWFSSGETSDDRSTVRMVAFNPHGTQLFAVKDDSTVWMWDEA